MTTLTSGQAQAAAYIIEALKGRPRPAMEVFDAAMAAGVEVSDYQAAIKTLGIGSRRISYEELFILFGACLACAAETPHRGPYGIGPLCPGCTSPVRVWQWRVVPEGGKRATERMQASHKPTGHKDAITGTRYKACGSTLDRARDRRPMCSEVPVWHVTRTRGGTSYGSYWCDVELPAVYRAEVTEANRVL